MADFISTTGGKIVNVEAIAFLTTRTPAAKEGETPAAQLIVGFAAASPSASGSIMPLSLVMKSDEALEFCKKWLTWGAGPRAGLNLILGAKAQALLNGQTYVSCDDVAQVAPPIFRHRIIPNFSAQSEGLTPDDITAKILESVPKTEKLD